MIWIWAAEERGVNLAGSCVNEHACVCRDKGRLQDGVLSNFPCSEMLRECRSWGDRFIQRHGQRKWFGVTSASSKTALHLRDQAAGGIEHSPSRL